MSNYMEKPTEFAERLANTILNKWGVDSKQNNLVDKTAVDLIINSSVKVDVQYSQNFLKWGDLRIDFVSAYKKTNQYQKTYFSKNNKKNIFNEFEEKFNFTVQKKGKYFIDNYLDSVIVLFYKNHISYKQIPDYMMIINKTELLSYIENNFNKILQSGGIKLNDKIYNKIDDVHGSAFIPINVNDLYSKTNCFFGDLYELAKVKEQIKNYLLK